ncbi:hypothetical protein [Nocardia arthritidis]|uniref:hypothetical protein n=1 Tax=Nocardia arthritidis TaxID=228602 RepID=UPI000AC21083|nr:hypothetical protein [Nocardia arthritidis]
MLPLTLAALTARPLEASADPLPWLPLGDLATGSSGAAPGSDIVNTGNGSSPDAGTPSSGSASGLDAEGATSGGSLALGPVRLPSGSAGLSATGSAEVGGARGGPLATGRGQPGDGTSRTADTTAHPDVMAGSPAETLQLDTGSVQSACAGSAATGSALLLLGLATGSGFGSFGSSLIGPGSSLVGPGSSGSALGSAGVGSAFSGSALLTCLLLLPTPPPVPMTPLELGPPIPEFRIVPSPAAIATQIPLQAEGPLPALPSSPPSRQRGKDVQAAEPPRDPEVWNLMRLMTVLVVTVITVVGIRISPGPKRTR